MQESGRMGKGMGWGHLLTQMEGSILGNGRMGGNLDKENSLFPMAGYIWEDLKMTKWRTEHFMIKMES